MVISMIAQLIMVIVTGIRTLHAVIWLSSLSGVGIGIDVDEDAVDDDTDAAV